MAATASAIPICGQSPNLSVILFPPTDLLTFQVFRPLVLTTRTSPVLWVTSYRFSFGFKALIFITVNIAATFARSRDPRPARTSARSASGRNIPKYTHWVRPKIYTHFTPTHLLEASQRQDCGKLAAGKYLSFQYIRREMGIKKALFFGHKYRAKMAGGGENGIRTWLVTNCIY